ncbi:calcium-translocating P-type ATPase, PMCA-type [Ileibacterium valens]|uniref:P-type Ca(2+) transporter n=1 Tax=Ileibacterium valens TaxID=1862668 RepID=A0A1U7NFR1_9FIRM|nr:calcium-translocating P-type ATPase, PMCA-type [Ileibacterium valens]OLU36693.1 calcium-translocating P-type ATPase, PMCA-type [Erysipelotrichaceae bacterium NYU-BL-F16]OLU38399.1 calcium-translocating P-type ATPase, PMCA-type [Erysipelotrichaceae bacterium NYU-BL-E8]OLU39392.1 calcium-translocating P-type ATPase, PMCA-type [Ileibacterium valens]
MEKDKIIGLTSAEAEESKKKFGTNALSVKETETFWDMYKDAFNDIWIKILCAACILQLIIYVCSFIWPAYFHQDLIEILGVVVAIFLATFVGTLQNYKNNQQFNVLQAEASKIKTKVYRDGRIHEMPIDDIVKGDVILLQAGDQVPVDGVLVKGSCKVNQASLNGESRDESKETPDGPIDVNIKCEDFANPNWIFRGSVVTSGEVLVEAEIIGDHTVLGGISEALGETSKPSPSAEKMEILAGQIGKLGVAGAALAVAANLVFEIMGMDNYAFASMVALAIQNVMLFVSIIIMAVPEGLPLMSALVSSMNSGRMLKEHILVRHSDSIETAGYMNRLFSDKTGTITEGVLSVVDWISGDGKVVSNIDDLGYELKKELINGIGLNNDAISSDGKAIGSNGTDRALMNYLISLQEDSIDRSVIIEKEPFDSQKKFSKVILQDCSYLKGAPDFFIDQCRYYMNANGQVVPFTDADRAAVDKTMHEQMARSMRLLLIMKEDQEHGPYIYLGIVCIRDNVRSDVAQTVKTMKTAGCEVVMVTGDNAETATAIAKEAGILQSPKDIVLTSDELEKIDDEELKKILPDLRVVSRAKPMDKKRLVDLAQSLDYVVGMTGDGVNDSPALKAADVGFSMGDGTSVAKEASDIVIVNNSLTSISNALKYGRTMTKSVQKFIIFQLTVNVATILMNIVAPFLGFTEPFTIVQILWINLIMDTLAALAFGEEPALDRYMKEKPISRKAPVLTRYMIESIATAAIYITIVSSILLKAQSFLISIGLNTEAEVRTFVFTFFIYAVIFNSLNTRSSGFNLFEHISENRKFMVVMTLIFVLQTVLIYFAGAIFNTVPISMPALFTAMGFGFLIIPVDMLKKLVVGSYKKIAH